MGEDVKLQIGMKGLSAGIVTKENTALAMGSGDVEVFATPAMIALMEGAAVNCVKGQLPSENTSVGTRMNVSHVSATPLNSQVRAEATLINVEGRRLFYAVIAFDETGKIGEGTHERAIVDREKFMSKIAERVVQNQ